MKKAITIIAVFVFIILAFSTTAFADTEKGTSPSALSSLTIEAYPEKTVYGAFEKFDGAGLSVLASYTDGSVRKLTSADMSVSYMQDNCLRVGDEYVRLSYGGLSLTLPVTVNRISYDLSALSLSSSNVSYNGAYQSYGAFLPQIVGLDGIPLIINSRGGGVNAGVYEVSIDFKTESRDYITPESRVVSLTIEPCNVDIFWSELSFTYDGKSKAPVAHYVDVRGNKVYPAVTGAATNAGQNYTAVAIASDPNYRFIGASASYEIKKADYDFSSVKWSSDSFVYDGSKKSISASGLPAGVSIIGYSGDRATNAGKYTVAASLSWDKENYNTPTTLTHIWEILPADYDMSLVSFKSESFVFDGKMHYPTLVGRMPTGKDGITLEYRFSAGACHVSDGVVSVIISFYSESKNYKLPSEMYSSVTITPKRIEILWGESSLSYTGEAIAPSAFSDECVINVKGTGTNVGNYTATAVSDSADFVIINDKLDYSITKAQNYWTVSPASLICYEGREIKLSGESKFGQISYSFYSDSNGKNAISTPTSAGRYYVVMTVGATDNYSGLSSEVISFEIVKIEAVSFFATIKRNNIKAFERLLPDDLICVVINNDGSETTVDSSLVRVIYPSGDSLRKSDTAVVLKYGKFTLSLPINVGYADYDLSKVSWEYTDPVYDGKPKCPIIVGLPAGVRVVEYVGSGVTEAGSYKVSALVEYDSENYNQPILPICHFTIKKCPVKAPIITSVYNGEAQLPVSSSWLFTVTSKQVFSSVGKYSITVELTDKDNYIFEGNSTTASNAIFEILPATLSVKVQDLSLHLFEPIGEVDYVITAGELFGNDKISVLAYIDGNKVLVRSQNPNYTLKVEAGRLTRLPYPTLRGGIVMLLVLLLIALLVYAVILAYQKRERIISALAVAKCRWHNRSFKANGPRSLYDYDEIDLPEPTDTNDNTDDGEEMTEESEEDADIDLPEADFGPIDFDVDAERADSLITDSLAKSLLKKNGEIIYTDGSGKSIVNVDTISDAFVAGDRVDVNILKAKGIISPDTAYIKVLARGKIDKPLNVYANEFSLSAIKMIALTGGQSVKVTTKIEREKG